MSFALLALAGNIVCWRLGDWKNWKEYYTTILYAYLCNLVYDVICFGKPLWAFGELAYGYPALDLAVMALLCPAAEFAAYSTGGFTYYNGWTKWYSFASNLAMFPLLRLHHRRPLLAWPVSAALCAAGRVVVPCAAGEIAGAKG